MVDINVALLKLAARLPLRVSHAIGGILGTLVAAVPNGARHITDINLALCLPELDDRERRRLRRVSLMHTARMLLEAGRIWLGPRDEVLRMVREVVGGEHLEAAFARGRGVIMAAPHLGCWEVINTWLATRYRLTTMYKPQEGPVDALILAARAATGARMVPTDNQGVRALLAALRRNEMAGVLPDQDGGRNTGVFVEFFGHRANTPVLAPKLAAKTGASVVFAYGERLPRGRGFRIQFVPGAPEIRDPDTRAGARALNRGIEQCVRQLPEQYWWSYKRFRRRPQGAREFY
ncbi:MAG TPA: lysophospholipid acyltransferase family protein [Gammaproteobacteria bacterium]|nr:lysophospholipid acyltransferase family protein [Gammaproteobacteria bacterium]